MSTDPLITYLTKIGRRNSAADIERLQRIWQYLHESIALLQDLGVADESSPEPAAESASSIQTDGIAEPIRSAPLPHGSDSSDVDPAPMPTSEPTESGNGPTPSGEESPPSPETLIKTLGSGRLGHYAVVWGDPDRRDLYREYFTPNTEDLDIIFKAIGKLPLLYHHGLDSTMRSTVVGIVDTMRPDSIGIWVESQINMANAYAEAILQLAEQKKLGTSTGTLPGVRDVGPNGEIRRWAIAEVSLTPTPAEPRMRREVPVQVLKTYYDALGLELPAVTSGPSSSAEAERQALALERERIRLLALTL